MKSANRSKTIRGQDGFTALISSILVSGILLVLAASISRAAFWGRFASLARENKNIAAAMAQGCAHQALLGIAKNENVLMWQNCQTLQIDGSNPYTIIASAKWKNSFANLKITAESQNGEINITNWEEF